MEIVRTDGADSVFVSLCRELDSELDELIGAEVRRVCHCYNNLDVIKDVFVAYIDGVPVGCASFKRYSDAVAEVKRVFVRREFRGKGIARRLMSEVENAASELGFSEMVLETGEALVAAVKMYAELGYLRGPKYPPYEESPISLCMYKSLIS